MIGVRDELRDEAEAVIESLNKMGIGVTMLTGDNTQTAEAIARQAGIGDCRAELRPEDKARIVNQLSAQNPTAMIGDGINDAPALAAADIGIAMGATGSDAAIESADVAFTGHDLRLIPHALEHAREGRRIINQNVVLSIVIITALVPLAAVGALGLAAVVLVHEIAEVVVIGNGLRAARTSHLHLGT
jgi:cation-transporting ATPase G